MDPKELNPPAIVTTVDKAAELMAQVNSEYQEDETATRQSAKRRRKIGGWLKAIKNMLPHGKFQEYLTANFKGSYPTAVRRMREYEEHFEKDLDSMPMEEIDTVQSKISSDIFGDVNADGEKASEIPDERQPGEDDEPGANPSQEVAVDIPSPQPRRTRCDKCTRFNLNVPACMECARLKAEAKGDDPKQRSPRHQATKQGQPKFSMNEINKHAGKLLAEVNKILRCKGHLKDGPLRAGQARPIEITPEYSALQDRLGRILGEINSFHEAVKTYVGKLETRKIPDLEPRN
jgi:hypothetical protein